jgi:hypothetical protein
MTTTELNTKLKEYIFAQIDSLSKDTPVIGFVKPLLTRAINKNFSKVKSMMDLIADEEGNIDIENILEEMTESVMNTKSFTCNTGFIGDIEIGDGAIKLKIPMTNKTLAFNVEDIKEFRKTLITE